MRLQRTLFQTVLSGSPVSSNGTHRYILFAFTVGGVVSLVFSLYGASNINMFSNNLGTHCAPLVADLFLFLL